MSRIIRTEPSPILAKAVEYHGFVYTQGMVTRDSSLDITGQVRDVLAQIDAVLETHGTDNNADPAGADLAEAYRRSRGAERSVVGVAT